MHWTKQKYQFKPESPEELLVCVSDDNSGVRGSVTISVLDCPVGVMNNIKDHDWSCEFLKALQRIALVDARRNAALAADFFNEVDAMLEEDTK
jgi:hypothetical protein